MCEDENSPLVPSTAYQFQPTYYQKNYIEKHSEHGERSALIRYLLDLGIEQHIEILQEKEKILAQLEEQRRKRAETVAKIIEELRKDETNPQVLKTLEYILQKTLVPLRTDFQYLPFSNRAWEVWQKFCSATRWQSSC